MTSEADFYRQAEEWVYRLLEFDPVAATQVGEHRWDDRLASYDLVQGEEQNRQSLAALAEFQAVDLTGFSLDARIDHTLVVHLIQQLVRRYERVEDRYRNPGLYSDEIMGGVFTLILNEFAPLPERLRSVLGRVRQAPRVLEEAHANLVPARVPRVWAEVVLEQVRQTPGLLAGLLPALAAQAAPELVTDLTEAGQVAAQAFQAYADFLQQQVLPQAAGGFAAGRDLFEELLREEHMVDYDTDQLLEVGWEQFRQTREQMKALAQQIDPHKTVQELLEEAKADHPSAAGLLPAYEEAMAAARRYVVEHQIASIPEGESLRIIETPLYLRPVIPYAAYMPPGMLEEKQEGVFIVTSIDPDTPPEQQEQQLKGHHCAKLPVTALHEAYPGHHLQLVWANRQKTLPRRLGTMLSPLFLEGWAFYCEEMMEQLGYIAQPIQRLGRLSDQLWRAARIILDVSLHVRGMPVDEAVDFLVRECQLEPSNALAEVRRYTFTPTQPQCYLMGKLALLDLVADYRRAHPEASLREVHDAILGCGSLTPRLMRQRLGLAD